MDGYEFDKQASGKRDDQSYNCLHCSSRRIIVDELTDRDHHSGG